MIIILLIVIIGAILFPNFFKFAIELAVLCVRCIFGLIQTLNRLQMQSTQSLSGGSLALILAGQTGSARALIRLNGQ